MSVDAISNVSQQLSVSNSSNPASGVRQNLRNLEQALLNGDLSGAQSAFASLQQAASSVQASTNPNSIASQLGQSSSPLGQDMQALSSALAGNDVTGAQKAFAKLQQDMQSTFQANAASHAHHGHHGHHAHGGEAADNDASAGALNSLLQSISSNGQSTTSSATDFMSALQSLAASNPKVANDLVNLVNDLNGTGSVINTTA